MSEVFASVGELSASRVRLVVANTGPWWAECDFEDDAALSGRVELQLGELKLSGTVVPQYGGTHALRRQATIIAGAAGWGASVAPKDYHNDAGVKARTVAEDAARAVGEALGTFTPGAERVGIDYVRQAGPASRALEDVAGEAAWWVDYAGVTHVGARSARSADPAEYEVLEYEPRARVAMLAVDDLTKVGIGSVLVDRLDEPQTVRELEVLVEGGKLRVKAWCGGTDRGEGRLAGVLRGIVERLAGTQLFARYRYRVVLQAGDGRLSLQAVRKRPGLPDVLPISIWPGIAAAEIAPELGTEVLVEFIEGDAAQPAVTGFQSAADGAVEVAYKGADVEVALPPAVFTGTIGGAPATGVLAFPLSSTKGVVTAGSPRLKVKPQ
jgi:hypothetical protein